MAKALRITIYYAPTSRQWLTRVPIGYGSGINLDGKDRVGLQPYLYWITSW